MSQNNTDLDINHYSQKELLNLLGYGDSVPHNKEQIITCYTNKIDTIKAVEEITQQNKLELMSFFEEVKDKIIRDVFSAAGDKEYMSGELIQNSQNFMLTDNQVDGVEHPVIVHDNLPVNPVYTQEHVAGIINPLKRRIIKKVLLIDTKFRKDYKTTDSTDFTIQLPMTINNAISMKLAALEFPNTSYSFNSTHKTNEFTVDVSGSQYTIVIPDGNYTTTDIVNMLNKIYFNPSPISGRIQTFYDSNTGKLSFYVPAAHANIPMSLDFRIQSNLTRSVVYNFGWLLGFREPTYSNINNLKLPLQINNPFIDVSGYSGESIFDAVGTKYIYVVVNDFKMNQNDYFVTAFLNSISKGNVLAKVQIAHGKNTTGFEDSSDGTLKMREYFGPQDINKLKIQILDDYERVIDINKSDYSLTLEFECVYNM